MSPLRVLAQLPAADLYNSDWHKCNMIAPASWIGG